jgi:diguanylate cyclase
LDIKEINYVAKETLKYMVDKAIPISPENYNKWYDVFLEAISDGIPLTDLNIMGLYKEKYSEEYNIQDNEEYVGEPIPEIKFKKVLKRVDHTILEVIKTIDDHKNKIEKSKEILDEEDDKDKIKKILNEMVSEYEKLKQKFETHHQQIENIQYSLQETKKSVYTDELTGLLSHSEFERIVKELIENKQKFATIIVKIDSLHNIENIYSKEAAELVIKKVSQLLLKSLRSGTPIFRLEEDEFGVLLIKADIEHLEYIANRLRKLIENKEFLYNGKVIKISATFVLTEYIEGETFEEFEDRIQKAFQE